MVKKRKGIRVCTITIPDSDEENPALDVNTEYVRLLKTRVAPSGKADSVAMDSLALFEVKDVTHDDSLEPTINGHEEIAAEGTMEGAIPATTAKKRRKKNDSVR